MTLLDLFRLIGRYWKLCVALPVLCALACVGYLLISHSDDTTYTAQSRIVVSTHVQDVGGLAQAQGRAYTTKDGSINATAAVDANTKTVTITVVTTDSDLSIKLANDIANSVIDEAFDFVPEVVDDPFNARIEKAEAAKETASSTDARNVLLASVFAGLLLAVCLVVVINAVRRPIKGSTDLADASGLRVLGEIPGDTGERLLANVHFASGKSDLHKILVVPVRQAYPADLATELISQAAQEEHPVESGAHSDSIQVSTCLPLMQDMAGVYQARSSDIVLIAASQWDDTKKDVESTVNELKFVDASIAGCVYVKAAKGAQRHRGITR